MSADLRSLRCFLAVCAAGSISKAAERMHIAQPAMSMQIKGLEQALGLQLFERNAKGVRPTPAGYRLEQHSRSLLASFENALQDVRRLEASPAGPVCIGLPQSMARLLTVPLVSNALARWPDVRLQVAELSTGYIPEQLLQGHIDMGLTFQQHASSDLHYDQIAEESLVLIAPPGRLATHDQGGALAKIRFAEIPHLPLILPAPEHGLRMLLEQFARASHLELSPIAEVNAIHQLIDVVSSGVGYSLLSYASVVQEIKQGRLSAAEITDPPLSRPVFLARRATATQSIAASCVCTLLQDTVRDLVAAGIWPARGTSARGRPAPDTR